VKSVASKPQARARQSMGGEDGVPSEVEVGTGHGQRLAQGPRTSRMKNGGNKEGGRNCGTARGGGERSSGGLSGQGGFLGSPGDWGTLERGEEENRATG